MFSRILRSTPDCNKKLTRQMRRASYHRQLRLANHTQCHISSLSREKGCASTPVSNSACPESFPQAVPQSAESISPLASQLAVTLPSFIEIKECLGKMPMNSVPR